MKFDTLHVWALNLSAIVLPPLAKLNAVLQSISLLLAIGFTAWNWRRKAKTKPSSPQRRRGAEREWK